MTHARDRLGVVLRTVRNKLVCRAGLRRGSWGLASSRLLALPLLGSAVVGREIGVDLCAFRGHWKLCFFRKFSCPLCTTDQR